MTFDEWWESYMRENYDPYAGLTVSLREASEDAWNAARRDLVEDHQWDPLNK